MPPKEVVSRKAKRATSSRRKNSKTKSQKNGKSKDSKKTSCDRCKTILALTDNSVSCAKCNLKYHEACVKPSYDSNSWSCPQCSSGFKIEMTPSICTKPKIAKSPSSPLSICKPFFDSFFTNPPEGIEERLLT